MKPSLASANATAGQPHSSLQDQSELMIAARQASPAEMRYVPGGVQDVEIGPAGIVLTRLIINTPTACAGAMVLRTWRT